MSGKNVIRPFKMIDAGDMSSNITSEVVNVLYMDNIGIQTLYTGSPVGEIEIQVSNDYDSRNPSIATWTALNFGATLSVSAAGNDGFNIKQVPFENIRLVYSATSGTGALTATITGKRIGG